MKRILQFSLGTIVVILGGLVLSLPAVSFVAAEQGLAKLPLVDKKADQNYTQKIPGSDVSFDMIAIPGGAFLMGSPASEKDRDKDESPQHPVKMKPFWMGKCEVRWDEYDLYWIKKKGYIPKTDADKKAAAVTGPTKPYMDETFGHGRRGKPVLNITHHSAMQYCLWLSAKTGKTYRLPTEAEWEWACRAGTTSAFYFGDDPKKIEDHAWYWENADETTSKVGTKKPNPWGLYDMYGNVTEWCLDHYSPKDYQKYTTNALTLQPVRIPTDQRYSHVVRGGSWLDPAKDCRSAARTGSNENWMKRDPQNPKSIWWMTDADFVGFRVVCPVVEQANLKGLKSKVTEKSQ